MGADGDEERPTMATVSHENPRTGSTLGEIFRRGPTVADGGESIDERSADGDEDSAEERLTPGDEPPTDRDSMADVDHTARQGDRSGVERVWSRGREDRP